MKITCAKIRQSEDTHAIVDCKAFSDDMPSKYKLFNMSVYDNTNIKDQCVKMMIPFNDFTETVLSELAEEKLAIAYANIGKIISDYTESPGKFKIGAVDAIHDRVMEMFDSLNLVYAISTYVIKEFYFEKDINYDLAELVITAKLMSPIWGHLLSTYWKDENDSLKYWRCRDFIYDVLDKYHGKAICSINKTTRAAYDKVRQVIGTVGMGNSSLDPVIIDKVIVHGLPSMILQDSEGEFVDIDAWVYAYTHALVLPKRY